MEYKLTFNDGSSAYLAHHGVKGMKWGIWNAATKARYAAEGVAGGREEDDDLDFNAEDYGFEDNSPESKRAALEVSGLSPNMTREQAIKAVFASHKKTNSERKRLKGTKAVGRILSDFQGDLKLANSLPTKKQKMNKAGKSINKALNRN